MENNLNTLPKPEINQVDTFGFDISDTLTGFEGWFTTPMRKQIVKRYKINQNPYDFNECQPLAKCIGNTHDLTKLKIVGYVPLFHLRTVPKLDLRCFDYVMFISEKHGILKFAAKIRGQDSVTIKCKRLI